MRKKRTVIIVVTMLIFSMTLSLVSGCASKSYDETNNDETLLTTDISINNDNSKIEALNLQKLCKVWGYVKYTHPAFLLGRKNWDEELLGLIPKVSDATDENEVNNILSAWFESLGDIDYGSTTEVLEWKNLSDEDISTQCDIGWISDKSYLGSTLSSCLLRLNEIPVIDRSKAPVCFDRLIGAGFEMINFQNESVYSDMDYSDTGYRLLGLFRFWNAIEYCFPYKDIMDYNRNDILNEYIPKMIEGTNKQSYELTLSEVGAKLNDAHVYFSDMTFALNRFGNYIAPVSLTKAEGKLVVWETYEVSKQTCPLIEGDIILKLDGVDIDDVIADRVKYISVTSSDKILSTVAPYLLRSHNEQMEITVLRDNEEITETVIGKSGYFNSLSTASESH